jgi:8-amino-7-oxononanoate synthase
MPRLNVASSTATSLVVDGRELLAFAGCNYLGFAQHPAILAAAAEGLTTFGISTSASRETTGNTQVHDRLEVDLAAFTRQEAAILLAEGYTANFAVAQGLSPTHGIALIDAKAHRSIRNAATAAGMQVMEYEHLNPDSAAWLVRQYADQGVAIFTDGIFAADGAIAPLEGLLRVLPAQRGTLVVDDCHGFCVMGEGGRGLVDHAHLDDPRICITTTLAKGLGCYGGAVIGRRRLVDAVRSQSDVYRRSTPVPTPIAMAAREAIRLLSTTPSLVQTLRDNTHLARRRLEACGVRVHRDPVPVFTFVLDGGIERMEAVHRRLLARDLYAPLIEYPGGPSPRYFRLTMTACHTAAQIDRLGDELSAAMAATA